MVNFLPGASMARRPFGSLEAHVRRVQRVYLHADLKLKEKALLRGFLMFGFPHAASSAAALSLKWCKKSAARCACVRFQT
jgi:hypothetical protein